MKTEYAYLLMSSFGCDLNAGVGMVLLLPFLAVILDGLLNAPTILVGVCHSWGIYLKGMRKNGIYC